MLSFHFFSQSVEEAFLIFPWQQRGTLGKASSCGNLFEMSENLAVRSLGHYQRYPRYIRSWVCLVKCLGKINEKG